MLSIAMLVQAIAAACGRCSPSRSGTRGVAAAALVNIVVNAGVSLVLVQHIGLLGALIGSVAGDACASVLFLFASPGGAVPLLRRAPARIVLYGTAALAIGCWRFGRARGALRPRGCRLGGVVPGSLLLRGEAAPRRLLAQLRERGSSTAAE